MRSILFLSLALVLTAGLAQAQQQAPQQQAPDRVILQGLDKITARVSTFEAVFGAPVMFGSLEITARACYKAPPEDPPESTAFLQIRDIPVAADPVDIFDGWMFASSPAVSALEHPVFDVWVRDCGFPPAPEAEGEESSN